VLKLREQLIVMDDWSCNQVREKSDKQAVF